MMRSWVVYEGPIRLALHTLKYKRNITLGDTLARQLTPFVKGLDWPIEVVVPVPLGRKRLRERGYNQVGLIARPLASSNGWQYCPQALARARETRSQVGLTSVERQVNVKDAFCSEPARVSGKNILLMDDIVTTGATMSACASALVRAGARQVYALTLARALPQHGLNAV
jgi:ComF family protein